MDRKSTKNAGGQGCYAGLFCPHAALKGRSPILLMPADYVSPCGRIAGDALFCGSLPANPRNLWWFVKTHGEWYSALALQFVVPSHVLCASYFIVFPAGISRSMYLKKTSRRVPTFNVGVLLQWKQHNAQET